MVCQFCKQVEGLPSGVRLSSAAKRLGGHLLDVVLLFVTVFIGYVIWSFMIYGRGQTPAKQLLNMRVVKLETGRAASWGTMFVREWIAKTIIWLLAGLTLYIVLFWVTWDRNNQELWDKMVGTVVVNDPDGVVPLKP